MNAPLSVTLEQLRESYDWQIIFDEPDSDGHRRTYGASISCSNPHNPLTREPAGRSYHFDDIAEIIAVCDGEDDGDDWLGLFRMTDGRYLFVSAGCDYSGWDCQSDGTSEWTNTLAEAIAAMPAADRSRLSLEPTP